MLLRKNIDTAISAMIVLLSIEIRTGDGDEDDTFCISNKTTSCINDYTYVHSI